MMIPVAAIDLPPDFVVRDEKKLDEIYFSIKSIGVINPPTVVPNEEISGRYWVVAGKHRMTCIKRLGWEMAECHVRSLTEDEAEMVECSENIHRIPLGSSAHDKALARYAELYAKRHPEVAQALAEQRRANLRNVAERKQEAEVEAARTAAPRSVIQAVADSQGVSTKTVREAIVRANNLADDTRLILEQAGLSKERITRVARLPPHQKSQVTNLVAAQMSYPAAMKEVLGDEYEGDPEEDDGESDEDFLRQCPIRSRVNQARFDAEAIRFKRCQKAQRVFAQTIGWGKLKKQLNGGGLYSNRLLRLLATPDPRDWTVCHACTRGVTKDGDCPKCKGGGFLLG